MAFPHETEFTQRWHNFLQAAKLTDGGEQVFAQVISAYSGPTRHYHGLDHILYCLNTLDAVRGICPDPVSVEAAVWFHDIVYDAHRNDNEQESANLARQLLSRMGAEPPWIEGVMELIMDTLHQQKPETLAGQYLADIDLSSLGLPAGTFDAHGRAIQREYSHLQDKGYISGRNAIFQAFLARPSIYYSEYFRSRFESSARANLQRVLGQP